MPASSQQPLPIIGWREWLSLPDLRVDRIKVKIDTGARSSALHAFDIHIVEQSAGESAGSSESGTDPQAVKMVHFKMHPYQDDISEIVEAQVRLSDIRTIRSSNGQAQTRPVIQTMARLGEHQWPIELTLTNRDDMGFRMLLGRQAIRQRFLIDAGQSYLQSHRSRKSR